MAKKRQQDFAKIKLKPGRNISKRRNITKTSFVTKKITVQTKKNQKTKFSLTDCLKCLKGGYTAARLNALRNLQNVIENQEESFIPLLSEVLDILSKVFIESDENIRNISSDVICLIISKSSESETFKMKLSSFTDHLIKIISAGISHTALSVKQNTLSIMSCVLTHYPNLICNSFTLLKSLLNMMVTRRKSSQLQTLKSRSSLATVSDSSLVYDNWRINVLKTMNMFLKETLRKFETNFHLEEESGENEVYYDGKHPLYIQIYDGSGLKPFDIEKTLATAPNSKEMNFENPAIVDEFLIPVLDVISEIYHGEIAGKKKGDDSHFPINTIRNLNVLFELLYHITEWVQVIPYEEVKGLIAGFLLRDVYRSNLFPFHPSGIFNAKNQSPEVAQLNLNLCFLHGKFLLHSEDCDKEYTTSSLLYIKSIFQMSYEIRFNSIFMIVKILRIYYALNDFEEVSEFIVDSLSNLSYFLQKISDGHNKDALISLFMKLSLHPAYHFLIDTVAMQKWFSWLLSQLFTIPKTDEVNRNLLRITQKIANRRYPNFLDALSGVNVNQFKAVLKYDNDLVRDTATFLLYNMKEVKDSFLNDISNMILVESTFPLKFTTRLIRLLTSKFIREKPSRADSDEDREAFGRGRTNFITFLINVAIDSRNLANEELLDYDTSKYTKAMEPLKDACTYNVIPSLKWKEHSELFEVCRNCLSRLPQKLTGYISVEIFKEILESYRNLPMHCVLSILKLNVRNVSDSHYHYLRNNLVFSSLLTVSVLTQMTGAQHEWFLYNVNDLVDSLNLTRNMALETLIDQLQREEDLDGLVTYHFMRICAFYFERRVLRPEDGDQVLSILEGFKAKCTDKSFGRQPLYQQLISAFYDYYN